MSGAGPSGLSDEIDVPIHACPIEGSGGLMACCGRTPFEVRAHRMTNDLELVTCWTGNDPRLSHRSGVGR